MIELIVFILVFFYVLIISEIVAYFWHRFCAHSIGPVEITHQIHHRDNDLAGQDYYWIMIMLSLFGLFLILLSLLGLPWYISLPTFLASVLYFYFNHYIHASYHVKNHYLNKYPLFRTMKINHFLHHSNPDKNYSIITPFPDQYFGSYKCMNTIS